MTKRRKTRTTNRCLCSTSNVECVRLQVSTDREVRWSTTEEEFVGNIERVVRKVLELETKAIVRNRLDHQPKDLKANRFDEIVRGELCVLKTRA